MKNKVRLDTPSVDGTTARDHLLAVARIPGAPRPSELDAPTEPPLMFVWVWQVFHALSGARQYNSGQALPISHQEILAWSQLYSERLAKRDISLIRTLDTVWINTRIQLSRAA